MKIKSLLLGSAAAMFAVSGASAADAIVAAEPEPVEYVRVCDAFGNGYFFIPGTETCLRISGYVWFQVGAISDVEFFDDINDSYTNSTRARVNIDARSDTEWGELASRIRLQGTWGFNADGPDLIDQAWIRLGGLFMGYSESYWVNAYNTGPSNFGTHSWGGLAYGYQQRHLIGYTYNNGNFFISGSLENDTDGTNYTPDFVGKLGGTFGGATVWFKGGYDDTADGYGLGAGLNADIGPGNLILMGYYADSANSYGANLTFSSNSGLVWTPEWSVIASYGMDLGSTLYGSVGFQWLEDLYDPFSGSTNQRGLDAWQLEGSLVWTPVTNFSIRTEITYTEVSGTADFSDVGLGTFRGADQTQGFVRFQRNF